MRWKVTLRRSWRLSMAYVPRCPSVSIQRVATLKDLPKAGRCRLQSVHPKKLLPANAISRLQREMPKPSAHCLWRQNVVGVVGHAGDHTTLLPDIGVLLIPCSASSEVEFVVRGPRCYAAAAKGSAPHQMANFQFGEVLVSAKTVTA